MTRRDVIVTLPVSEGGCARLKEKIAETKDGFEEVWWAFGRLPKDLKEGSKIYVVCEGFIRGFFIVEFIDLDSDFFEVTPAFLKDWTPLEKPIPFKVRGFQYMTEEILQ